MPEQMQLPSELFSTLDTSSGRTIRLNVARECAAHSIPSLLPQEGEVDVAYLRDRFSAFTARGVSALATRMTSMLVPTNGRLPFEHEPDIASITESGAEQTQINEFRVSLAKFDRLIAQTLGSTNYRESVYAFVKNCIVLGDAVLHLNDDLTFMVYRLDNYVLRRDFSGEVYEAVFRDMVDPATLPPELANLPKSNGNTAVIPVMSTSDGKDQPEPIFTHIYKSGSGWAARREFRGNVYSQGTYKSLPYFFGGWFRIPGEDYYRSLIEDLIGDIRTEETLARALTQGAVSNSRINFLVNPGGITDIGDLKDAENGEFIPGKVVDIESLQAKQLVPLDALIQALSVLRRDLSKSFLMTDGIQRDAERQTATEWRYMAEQLDQMTGGVFTLFSREVQGPMLRRLKELLASKGKIPGELANDSRFINVKIRTGLESLNRELEGNKLYALGNIFATNPSVAQIFKWPDWSRDILSSEGFDPQRFIPTDKELQEQQQAAMQAQLAQQAAMTGIDALGSAAASQLSK